MNLDISFNPEKFKVTPGLECLATPHYSAGHGPQCLESQPSAKRPEFVSWYVHTSCVALDRSVLSLCLIFLVHLMRW